jgi:ABC-2 type transport system ATP-binding protein
MVWNNPRPKTMITAEHVSKFYGARAAISDLSFGIAKGEVIGLLGRNGAGKTTTLQLLSGLLAPTSGRMVIDGHDLREDPEGVRARIGFLPEKPPLYPEMTVEGFLAFVARIKGIRADVAGHVTRAVEATNLESVRHDLIATLSLGFQRRVGVAQAIVHRPALVLLDEPTSSLDPAQVVQMRELVRGLARQHTVIVSSHLLAEIEKTCDRLLLLREGKLVGEGTEEELARRVSSVQSLEVEVRGSAVALGRALLTVTAVRSHRVEADHDGVVRARVELATDAREELARALVEAGLGLRRLERQRLELEDVFLSLTGDTTREPD